MRHRIRDSRQCQFAALLGTLLLITAQGVSAASTDSERIGAEAAQLLSDYIKIDTTNPPGGEKAAALFLAKRFAREKITAKVFESEAGRGSVIARLKGTGEERPIILLNHLDVVPAIAADWDMPPFAGVQRDGFVYGRGALDCKGVGTVEAMTMFLLQRQGIRLKRDIIFLGTADEETGGKLGAGWMVANHFDKFADAEFVLNEGGAIHVDESGRRIFAVAVSEKTPCWLKLTATGEAGHGSAPATDTSVTRLVRALNRIGASPQPLRVIPEVQAYFAAIAVLQDDAQRQRYSDLRSALGDGNFLEEFLGNRRNAALVRNTLTPTILQAGIKTNVIPQTATAEIDCRLLPDEDPQAFVDTVRRTIDDPAVQVDVLLNFPPASSPTDSKLYAALRKMAEAEQAILAPTVLTGFTDSHYFRDKGIISYGFTPLVLDDGESKREHGINERVAISNLEDGTKRLINLLRSLDAIDETH